MYSGRQSSDRFPSDSINKISDSNNFVERYNTNQSPVNQQIQAKHKQEVTKFTLEINIPQDQVREETIFWADIMKEHMDFYYKLIEESEGQLKGKAKDLSDRWLRFKNPLLYSKDNVDIKTLEYLITQTGQYKNVLLDKIKNREYIGAIYESFVLETLKELEIFVAILENSLSPEDQITFWNEHSRDHALLNTRLLDPKMQDDFFNNFVTAINFDNLIRLENYSTPEEWLQQTLMSNENFYQVLLDEQERSKIKGPEGLSSVIMPELMKHVIKEVIYGIRKIAKLTNTALPNYLMEELSPPQKVQESNVQPNQTVSKNSKTADIQPPSVEIEASYDQQPQMYNQYLNGVDYDNNMFGNNN